ncbi:glycoside hydrolase family 20 zincin-like fold domain-containing protein [uncultured Lutibacter sp.]|nr:glycoside hydrolase family 20 zincin-like fold domain-containing protein [uncultured Lutibacter sp.]GGK46163.1 hypothetical protein GCM10007963_13060 [Lutibacter litoralis]
MYRFTLFSLVIITFFNVSCTLEKRNEINSYKLVSQPVELIPEEGSFELNENTKIYFHEDAKKLLKVSNQFINELKQASGIKIELTDKIPSKGISVFNDAKLPMDAYRLIVKKSGIEISSNTSAGVYYASQSMKQLIPVEFANSIKPRGQKCNIQAVTIYDKPEFSWRGNCLVRLNL